MPFTNLGFGDNGSWTTGKTYNVGDIAISSGYTIVCLVAHTAGTFATDVQSGYWQMSAPWKNYLHNSNFDIWQRGTADSRATNNRVFGPDRWGVIPSTNGSQAAHIQQQTTNLFTGTTFAMNFGPFGTNARCAACQTMESFDTIALRGKTVTVAAQFSMQGGTAPVRVEVLAWTGTADSLTAFSSTVPYATWSPYTLATNFTSLGSATYSVSSSYQKGSLTFTVPTNANNLVILYVYDSSNGFQVYTAQAMLNEGPAPAIFQTATPNVATELSLCYRYYEVFTGYGEFAFDNNVSTTQGGFGWAFKNKKRAAPTISVGSTTVANARYYGPSGLRGINAIAASNTTPDGAIFTATLASAAVQFQGGTIAIVSGTSTDTLVADSEF